MASRISIKNEALAQLPAEPIAAEGEASLAARETERYFDNVVKELLEAYDWGFATRRVILAETTNDRANEWLYAYAVPSDMGTPRRLIPDLEGLGLGIPIEGPFTPPYYEVWADAYGAMGDLFIIENGVIYSNIETATLEYGIDTVGPEVMPQLFRHAVACELAARIAMPIKKDRALKGDLIKEAEAAKSRALADDENRHPRTSPAPYISEVAQARGCY